MQITAVGLDIAKRVFQLHGVDAAGKAILRRKLQRSEVLAFFKALPPCLVGIEACGTAHYWAREIREVGHEVRLMPPSYVAAYVKRGKTDAADAAAICEAVTRPTMRFVPIKTAEQQAVLMLHRTRDLLVRQRTMLVNALRGHMAELGIIAPQGIARVADLMAVLLGEATTNVPSAGDRRDTTAQNPVSSATAWLCRSYQERSAPAVVEQPAALPPCSPSLVSSPIFSVYLTLQYLALLLSVSPGTMPLQSDRYEHVPPWSRRAQSYVSGVQRAFGPNLRAKRC